MAVWVGAADPLAENSPTRFCWFRVPVPAPVMPIRNERFCQITLFRNNGSEIFRQLGIPSGHSTVCPAKVAVSSVEFSVLLTPAGCGHDAVFVPVGPVMVQLPDGALAWGVPTLVVSTPESASESLWAMVLLMI